MQATPAYAPAPSPSPFLTFLGLGAAPEPHVRAVRGLPRQLECALDPLGDEVKIRSMDLLPALRLVSDRDPHPLPRGPVEMEGGSTFLVAQLAATAVELAADMGSDQPHLALGLEAFPEKEVLVDLEAVGGEGETLLVAQLAATAVELAADMGSSAGGAEDPVSAQGPGKDRDKDE